MQLFLRTYLIILFDCWFGKKMVFRRALDGRRFLAGISKVRVFRFLHNCSNRNVWNKPCY